MPVSLSSFCQHCWVIPSSQHDDCLLADKVPFLLQTRAVVWMLCSPHDYLLSHLQADSQMLTLQKYLPWPHYQSSPSFSPAEPPIFILSFFTSYFFWNHLVHIFSHFFKKSASQSAKPHSPSYSYCLKECALQNNWENHFKEKGLRWPFIIVEFFHSSL